MHLVGYIIRIYHNARSPERQRSMKTIEHINEMWSVEIMLLSTGR